MAAVSRPVFHPLAVLPTHLRCYFVTETAGHSISYPWQVHCLGRLPAVIYHRRRGICNRMKGGFTAHRTPQERIRIKALNESPAKALLAFSEEVRRSLQPVNPHAPEHIKSSPAEHDVEMEGSLTRPPGVRPAVSSGLFGILHSR